MMDHDTLQKLDLLKLDGFKSSLKEQLGNSEYEKLEFTERLGLMVDRELELRENKRLQARMGKARFKLAACIEDLDYATARNLDRSLVLGLANCTFISKGHNVLITGPTGVGKTFLACAIGNKACLGGHQVRYFRSSMFFDEMKAARFENKASRFRAQISKICLLILDDFGLQKLEIQDRIDFLDVIDDRTSGRSTIIVTQIPTTGWHEMIGDNTIADAIMDRFIHTAYQIEMKGESMRKLKNKLS